MVDEKVQALFNKAAGQRIAALLALILIPAAVAGCEDTTSIDSSLPIITPVYYPQLSSIEPPTPKPEVVPVIESPQTQIWKPGYWEQGGLGGFDWVSGEVVARPTPTAVWASAYWAKREYGWAFVPGYWE